MSFERRVAVRYMAAMLTGAARTEAEGWRVTQVAFQQGPAGPVDDLHVGLTRDSEQQASLELWVAVRRRPDFTRSDKDTAKLIGTLVAASEAPTEPGVERRLVVSVAGQQTGASELAELTTLARSMGESAFDVEMAADGRPRRALKARYEHVRDLVAAALEPDESASATTWRLLRNLHISMPRLESPEETDWSALLTELEGWARDQTAAGADVLRAKLESLAAGYAPAAAVLRREQLARDAHAALRLDRREAAAAWKELRRIDREARDGIRIVCGRDDVHLPRDNEKAALATVLDRSPVLIVSGDSGCGKSALVRSLVEHRELEEPDDFEAVVLNLRQLPRHPTELRAALGASMDRVLAEMHAPRRLLVIDGADVQAETDQTPLASVARSALEAGVSVCIIASSEGRAAVEGVAAHLGAHVAHHKVAGLTDEEVDSLVEQLPSLHRLADVPHSRELLRRPAIADLLARAHGDDVPLSNSAAMDVIWAGLVRNHERTVRGTPDARDHLFRQLGADALDPGRLDLGQLDADALDGLRRDGVLRSAESRWSTVPSFAHDILRTYAVARVLGESTQPVERLKLYNTPRWALPAIRLIVEQRLRSADPTDRLTLQDAQRIFDELAESGAGRRWGDVPPEAALGLPEAGQLLAESWNELTLNGGSGLKRLLRVVDLRHRRAGFVDRLVAHNLAALLLGRGWPADANTEVIKFLESWLLSLVIVPTPSGDHARQRLLELILHRVGEGERQVREVAEERAARLAARTAQEVAEADARAAKFAMFSSIGYDDDDDDYEVPARDLPGELTLEPTIRCLALLGPDMGSEGEALLRMVADRDPYRLAPALESPLAGVAVAQWDPKLLVDLVGAYYIDRQPRRSGLSFGYGIRGHEPVAAGPLPKYYRGPFLAMFHADFVDGVRCLNQMLNHAARIRIKVLGGYEPDDPTEGLSVELSLTGALKPYVGDGQLWLWYRGTGVGPYPCMSALQALEVVVDELIERRQLTPDTAARILLTNCDNLAMPALVNGMLVRHLEPGSVAIDPFLAEPAVWRLEFGRVTGEMTGLAAHTAPVTAADRRNWDPRRVAMLLALSADDIRANQLRELGRRLETRAQELEEDRTTARQWAAALDRNSYDANQTPEGIVVQQREDPEVAAALEAQRLDYARLNESLRLHLRYVDRFYQIRRPPPLRLEELTADVAVARDLVSAPPGGEDRLAGEGPLATAAAALEGAYLDGLDVPFDDLLWAAQVLLGVIADRISREPTDIEDDQWYPHGTDRSAARGLPLLCTPAATELRKQLEASDEESTDAALNWLFTTSPTEVRILASRALDAVWAAPCERSPCHHEVALNLVENSVRHASVRRSPWNPEDDRGPLAGPLLPALASAGAHMIPPHLSPALRALGAEARRETCVHSAAGMLLAAVLAAQRRSFKPFKHGYHQSESDALFSARAALSASVGGDSALLLEHARDLAADAPHALAEYVEALAAAAEEHPDLADVARAIWPPLMREVLSLLAQPRQASLDEAPDVIGAKARIRKVFDRLRGRPQPPAPSPVTQRRDHHQAWRDRATVALLPHMTYEHHYHYSELTSEPIRWPVPHQWRPEINSWTEASGGGREAIDAMVHMLLTQPIEEQAALGIDWVERLVDKDPQSARTFLLPDWLRDVRSYCGEYELVVWQRLVDTLVISGDTRVRDLAD